MKRNNEQGVGAIEVLLLVVIVGLVSGVGYYVLNQNHKELSSTASSTGSSAASKAVKADGSTQAVDDLSKQDANSEGSIDSKYETSEQSSAKTANQATSNVGGAYDESTF